MNLPHYKSLPSSFKVFATLITFEVVVKIEPMAFKYFWAESLHTHSKMGHQILFTESI